LFCFVFFFFFLARPMRCLVQLHVAICGLRLLNGRIAGRPNKHGGRRFVRLCQPNLGNNVHITGVGTAQGSRASPAKRQRLFARGTRFGWAMAVPYTSYHPTNQNLAGELHARPNQIKLRIVSSDDAFHRSASSSADCVLFCAHSLLPQIGEGHNFTLEP
jgi:hypothetical protein